MFVFLIASIQRENSVFECEFAPQNNEENKRFVLTVKKADWNDIKTEINQSFLAIKKTVVETSSTKLLNDLNLPLDLISKAEKVQKLIKHVNFKDIKNVYDSIVSEKTFTIDFNN